MSQPNPSENDPYQIISRQDKIINELGEENKALKKKVFELEEKLGLNSSNSSIPSSKELYKLQRKARKPSGRRPGGQPGHKGASRAPMPADEVVKISIPSVCECGGELKEFNKPYIHQKVEIPEIKPHVTEYQLAQGRCLRCGKRASAELPEGVTADTFGPRVKSIIGAFSGFYKNSKREIQNILKDMFDLNISLGSVSNSEGRVSKKCEEAYADIELEVSNSEIVHIDETSHYNKGKLGWCWLFASNTAGFIKLVASRGKKVLVNSIFGRNDNIIISDRYAVYNYFNREYRQSCWSHLERDFKRFAHSRNAAISTVGMYLCGVSAELFALRDSLLEGTIELSLFLRRANKLRKRTWRFLKEILNQQESPQTSRIAGNILKSEDMMWTFLYDPYSIPLTNNHAERQIRHYVVYRKNSYFTQSERGNTFLERVISLYLTSKLKGENPFLKLTSLVAA